jgi:hypothetical protein
VPRDKWPLWAKGVALARGGQDKGVGDTVERAVGPVGGEAFKQWYLNTFGKPCGCDGRKESWNTLYPYDGK